jgi:hypothetical protein
VLSGHRKAKLFGVCEVRVPAVVGMDGILIDFPFSEEISGFPVSRLGFCRQAFVPHQVTDHTKGLRCVFPVAELCEHLECPLLRGEGFLQPRCSSGGVPAESVNLNEAPSRGCY